jgi:formylglycine-generating enzyme required for sulfatase activity
MRGLVFSAGLFIFAMVSSCGFNPSPKDGKLSCSLGCPTGYVCRPADNRCWRASTLVSDSGIDGAVVTSDTRIDSGDSQATEAVRDVSTESTGPIDGGSNMDGGLAETPRTDTNGSDGALDSSPDVPVATGGTGGGTGGSGGGSGAGGMSGSGSGGSRTGGTTSSGGTTSTGGTTSMGGTTGAGGTTSTGGTTGAGCPASALEEMKDGLCVGRLVTVVVAGATFGIDAAEVTRGQYAAWLSTTTTATINAQDASTCSWNTTFIPSGDWTDPSARSNYPVAYVDWCDAYAYCKDVGKRLCGKIGGGANGFEDLSTATMSQWYAVCSSGGANRYPYLGANQATACNGVDLGKGTTTAVASLSLCQAPAPYAGVYDLSGNVAEWEDSCSGTGPSSPCRLRGGNFSFSSNNLACNAAVNGNRGSASDGIGFRCCSP